MCRFQWSVQFELLLQPLLNNSRPGFPMPTLLRLARLVKAHLQPLDIMQSYCHHTVRLHLPYNVERSSCNATAPKHVSRDVHPAL